MPATQTRGKKRKLEAFQEANIYDIQFFGMAKGFAEVGASGPHKKEWRVALIRELQFLIYYRIIWGGSVTFLK